MNNATMEDTPVTIVQQDRLVNIAAQELRIGDLVVVQAGDFVPADLSLVQARALEVDEFEITGEILPVAKHLDDQDARLYRGSRVTLGDAKGRVISTGANTELGAILAQDQKPIRPHLPRLFESKFLVLVGLLIPAFIFHLFNSNQFLAFSAVFFMISGSLIVLQNGALFQYVVSVLEQKKLDRLQIQICSQPALENLKDIDIFCFDKTGVLTSRQMSVRSVYFADQVVDPDQGFKSLDHRVAHWVNTICALGTDVLFIEKLATAHPVDKALIAFAQHHGVSLQDLMTTHRRIYDQPFDPENRSMACGYATDHQEAVYFLKGDPGVVLPMCKRYLAHDGSERSLDFDLRSRIKADVDAISRAGDTAIALAYASGEPGALPGEFVYACSLQLGNTLQPAAIEVIHGLQKMGIRTLMLTGDRPETAARISVASGMNQNPRVFLTGPTIDRMDLGEVARQAEYCSVFARFIPSQKGVLIRLLQQKGHTIAMVGDGANDGIALRVADVGISFVRESSPIARRFADVLIGDLRDILQLVESSRKIRARLMKLKAARLFLIAALFMGTYGWLFTAARFPHAVR